MLRSNGVPVEDYRVITVGEDFQIKYPEMHASRIERWEYGMGTDLEPKALLRKFTTRIPRYIEALTSGRVQ